MQITHNIADLMSTILGGFALGGAVAISYVAGLGIVGLGVVLSIFFLIYGGIQYILASDDADPALKIIKNSTVSLIVSILIVVIKAGFWWVVGILLGVLVGIVGEIRQQRIQIQMIGVGLGGILFVIIWGVLLGVTNSPLSIFLAICGLVAYTLSPVKRGGFIAVNILTVMGIANLGLLSLWAVPITFVT